MQLKVVERERIGWIMDEIGLENTPGKFDVASAVRVGKQLGVHAVVLGSFIKFKGDMWLGARLVKVETSEILATDDVKGDADEFFELAEKLSVKVAKGVNVNITEAQMEKGTETKSLDADDVVLRRARAGREGGLRRRGEEVRGGPPERPDVRQGTHQGTEPEATSPELTYDRAQRVGFVLLLPLLLSACGTTGSVGCGVGLPQSRSAGCRNGS